LKPSSVPNDFRLQKQLHIFDRRALGEDQRPRLPQSQTHQDRRQVAHLLGRRGQVCRLRGEENAAGDENGIRGSAHLQRHHPGQPGGHFLLRSNKRPRLGRHCHDACQALVQGSQVLWHVQEYGSAATSGRQSRHKLLCQSALQVGFGHYAFFVLRGHHSSF
jgi:hypothetical protein